jgi:hypothetical protein
MAENGRSDMTVRGHRNQAGNVGEDTLDHVLVDIDPECSGGLPGDTATARAPVALLLFNDCLDEPP